MKEILKYQTPYSCDTIKQIMLDETVKDSNSRWLVYSLSDQFVVKARMSFFKGNKNYISGQIKEDANGSLVTIQVNHLYLINWLIFVMMLFALFISMLNFVSVETKIILRVIPIAYVGFQSLAIFIIRLNLVNYYEGLLKLKKLL